MGFFKRLFSSKKNKSKRQPIQHDVNADPIPVNEFAVALTEDEHEATVGKLLRSRSARLAEMGPTSQTPYALPPISHPINRVIQTPASSCASLVSTSLSNRGTYTVTVHGRRRHSSTEFPLANSELGEMRRPDTAPPLAPVEDSRVIRLRTDPSVVSLLELYDDQGRVADDAFSNAGSSSPVDFGDDTPSLSPPKEGRAQVKRSGSTLRQLLGPSSDNSEGDISWADRFLAESESTSINSSSGLRTPDNDTYHSDFNRPEISFVADEEGSADVTATFDHPANSSMEVEVNDSNTSHDADRKSKLSTPYIYMDPATPQRASQVFGFITKGKQSKPPVSLDRMLPDPPSSPSDEGFSSSESDPRFSIPDNSADFSFHPNRFSAPPPPGTVVDKSSSSLLALQDMFVDNERTPRPHPKRASLGPNSTFSDESQDYHGNQSDAPQTPETSSSSHKSANTSQDSKQNDIRVLLTGPTQVIVTAPTPATNHVGPSRIPRARGPRTPSRKLSSGSLRVRQSVLCEVSNSYAARQASGSRGGLPVAGEPFVIVTPKKVQRRPSNSSVYSNRRVSYEQNGGLSISTPQPLGRRSTSPSAIGKRESWFGSARERSERESRSKENKLSNVFSLSVRNDLPSTPMRSNSTKAHHHGENVPSRNLFKSMVNQGMFKPTPGAPDPNKSSEMSLFGRQMMNDVRQQRLRAREAERTRFGLRP